MAGTSTKHAAFAREDIDDARRGHPNFDLREYAAARGLEFTDKFPPHVGSVTPKWGEYASNWMTGVLPGGEVGTLGHELMEVEVSTGSSGPRIGGKLWDEVYTKRDPFWFQPSYWKRAKDEPFAGNAIWIPTTRAIARVPQAALAPHVEARPSERITPMGRYELERHGLPGFALNFGGEADDPGFLDRVFGGAAGRMVEALAGRAYVELAVDRGLVSLRVNGFARAEGDLDEIGEAMSAIVAGVRDACAPYGDPQPFARPLTEAAWARDPQTIPTQHYEMLSSMWWQLYRDEAARLGLTLEDPAAYHRAFPNNPVPSIAYAVMRGSAPDGRTVRFVFHRVRHPYATRGAALFPSPPGWRGPTRIAEQDAESGLWVQGADDFVALWRTPTQKDAELDADDLIERAQAAAPRLGLAATG